MKIDAVTIGDHRVVDMPVGLLRRRLLGLMVPGLAPGMDRLYVIDAENGKPE